LLPLRESVLPGSVRDASTREAVCLLDMPPSSRRVCVPSSPGAGGAGAASEVASPFVTGEVGKREGREVDKPVAAVRIWRYASQVVVARPRAAVESIDRC